MRMFQCSSHTILRSGRYRSRFRHNLISDMAHYDAIIIGSGQAGKPLATAFGKAGWTTALVERAYIGGTCINYGCTPTKTMFNSARVAYLARRAPDFGVH